MLVTSLPGREARCPVSVRTRTGLPGGRTASLAASPDAHPDPGRRWIATVSAGCSYVVLALASAAFTTLVSAAPADVVGAVAGLALLGTLSASLAGALSAAEGREVAAITFVVAASGLTLGGIGAAFWALVAGLLVRAVLSSGRDQEAGR